MYLSLSRYPGSGVVLYCIDSCFSLLPYFDLKAHELPFQLDGVILYDFASGSEIKPCIKIHKPLEVYGFSGNVMASNIMTK